MADNPHPILMDRETPPKKMAEGYTPQLDLLTAMANYASNLIPRAYKDSKQELRDVIVCFSLLKQVAAMIDAVDILMRAGSIYAANVPSRAAYEASLYIEWMLVSDGEKKATHYVVGSIRERRLWAQRVKKGTPESPDFLKDMGQIGADIIAQRPALETEATSAIAEADRILTGRLFVETNASFDAILTRQAAKHQKPREPEWYKVLGKPSIRSIAKELQRLPEYIIYYGRGSKIVHSASYEGTITFSKGGAVAHPVRNLADAHTLFHSTFTNAIHTFHRVLGFYRPQELANFGAQYIREWRAAYMNIPKIKIESISKKGP
jgi:hypothetical protein